MSAGTDPYHPVYEETADLPPAAAQPVRRKGKNAIPHRLRRAVFDRDGGCCVYCGRPLAYVKATLDHIVPVCREGKSRMHNLATACGNCNANKGNKRVESWANTKALLRIQRIRATEPGEVP